MASNTRHTKLALVPAKKEGGVARDAGAATPSETHLSEVADFIDAMKNSFAEFASRRPAAPVERQNKTSLLDLEESILQEFRREQAMAFRQKVTTRLKEYLREWAIRESNSENTTGNNLELDHNPPAAIPEPAPETPPPETNEAIRKRLGLSARVWVFGRNGSMELIKEGDTPSDEIASDLAAFYRAIDESNSENTTGNNLELGYNPPAAIPQPAPELPAAPVERQDENSLLDLDETRARLAKFIAFDATAEQLVKVARVLAPENTPSVGEAALAATTQETKRAVNTSALGVRVKTEWLPVSELTEDQRTARREYQRKKKQRWRARQAAKATAAPSP